MMPLFHARATKPKSRRYPLSLLATAAVSEAAYKSPLELKWAQKAFRLRQPRFESR